MKKIILLAATAICFIAVCGSTPKSDDKISKIVSQMTREEKVLFVMGTQRAMNNSPEAAPGMPVRPRFNENARRISYFEDPSDATTAFTQGRVSGAAGETYAVPRLGIPIVIFADGPAGLRISPKRKGDDAEYYCTAFPTGSLLAASWDEGLVETVTDAMGNEVHEYGADFLLAPGMNIIRNPLCGRNFEYYSEDPLLSGKISAAYIRGIQKNGVGTSVKHFAVNNQETMRNGIDAVISERSLREIYLKGFEIAIKESEPWSVMSSYNKINGVLASENGWLLNDVLRGEWGYDGFVVTDWWAEGDGAAQVAGGNDLIMPGTQHQEDDIFRALEDGSLDEKLLDKAVANILRTFQKTPSFNHYGYSNKPDLEAHKAVVRNAAAQGKVLLENNGVLPLSDAVKRIALLGNASFDTYIGGSGSGNVNRKYKINICEGLAAAGYEVDESAGNVIKEHIKKNKPEGAEFMWVVPVVPEMEISLSEAERLASDNDIAIYTVSRMAGEGADRKLAEGDYYLSQTEESNIRTLSKAFHSAGKKLIILLNMGSMVEMGEWRGLADAILDVWLPGQEAGNSIADVITGKVNPSGKLPFTITAKYSDNPSSNDFPLSPGEDRRIIYNDGIYVGYRYYDSHNVTPTYPFGYGLSYTTFDYSDLRVSRKGDAWRVSLKVTNTGNVAGKEVVQFYVSAPKGKLDKPVKELKAFAKTGLIGPGETSEVTVTIDRQALASFDQDAREWIVDRGDYKIMAGASSRDVRLTETVTVK